MIRVCQVDWLLPYFIELGEHRLVSTAIAMVRDLDPNPHYFLHGSGYLYLLAAAFWGYAAAFLYPEFTWLEVGPETADFAFFRIGQGISILFSLLSIFLVYVISKQLFNRRAAILASFLMVICPLDISMAQAVKPITLLTFLGLLTFRFSAGIQSRGSLIDYIGAGAASGLAVGAGYGMPVLALVFAGHFLRSGDDNNTPIDRASWKLWTAVLAAVIVFAGTSPYVFLDFQAFWTKTVCTLKSGYFTSAGEPWYFTRPFRDIFGIFPVAFGPGVYLGAVWGFSRMPKSRMFLLSSYPFCYCFFAIPLIGEELPRHFLPILPFFLIAVSYLIVDLGKKSTRKGRVSSVLFLVLCLGYFGSDLFFPLYRPLLTMYRDAGEWVETNIHDPGSAILVRSPGYRFPLPSGVLREKITVSYRLEEGEVILLNPEYFVVPLRSVSLPENPRRPVGRLVSGEYQYSPAEEFRPGRYWSLLAALWRPSWSEAGIVAYRSTEKYAVEEKTAFIREILDSRRGSEISKLIALLTRLDGEERQILLHEIGTRLEELEKMTRSAD